MIRRSKSRMRNHSHRGNRMRTLVLFAIVIASPRMLTAQEKARPPVVLNEQGRKAHFESFVFDGQKHLWCGRVTKVGSSMDKRDIANHLPGMQTAIPRLRKGGVGA